ncbi:NAD-dependent epimerase/dehydratase family protein [Rugosimonospora africana]|uniref:Epimerase n=1 Tax=Rugosimonospora africana TaxID=556532 RepID=A0A8J3QSW7_9ACTN|nr:NAD-dependent epimerase/dehydratase family protein [Rugosimonospora africana]GIH16875.1 epimerase [Rugosimonospora africana]
MDVLVLGGTNFVGRHIVRALLDERHRVTVLNRGTNPVWGARVTQLVADRTDPASMSAAVRAVFDAVVDVSGTEPRHIESTAPLLRSLGVPRYVFISSGAVYDSTTTALPFPEDAPTPGDVIWGTYGTAKADCERLLRHYDFSELVMLRPPYVYGPGNNEQREQFLWARMLAARPVLVPGDGTTRIQFCPVAHLAETVVTAVAGKVPAGVYNVGEPAAYSFDDYVVALAGAAGVRRATVIHVEDRTIAAREYFPFRDYNFILDTSAGRRAGIPAPVGLATGLAETFAWFRANTDLPYEPTARESALLASLGTSDR